MTLNGHSQGKGPAPAASLRQRSAPYTGWLSDLLVGGLAGSIVVGGVGESILSTARVETATITTVSLVVCGSVLGLGFMRVVRRRAAQEDLEAHPSERAGDTDDPEGPRP